MDNIHNWIVTDSDNLQFRFLKSYLDIYTFKEINRNKYPDIFEKYKSKSIKDLEAIWKEDKYWIIDSVDLSEYTFTELLNHVTAYYNGLDDLIVHYKEDSEKIIAECIFEQENGLY